MNTKEPAEGSKIYFYNTVLGSIAIESRGDFISGLYFPSVHSKASQQRPEETEAIAEAYRQLLEYLSGNRKKFDLKLKFTGTEFQKLLWKTLLSIPYGNTCSYSQVAMAMGKKSAARAVGMACGRNPISIFVPCHRVIGSRGGLVGYSGGVEIKKMLLDLEKS
ncbi:MAG: methylated-DNA--[protein]-cysteine S-methyltransferase [Rickettsiales bacterium]|jgi:methylated-DNA-[protein]-cysteine S-methyltransferase|nr:methylated-DNA--[protein]-cysteine S-methyltransferase [Rickettsiales bacterium]